MATKNKNYSIGLDIGGTKISGVLFDGEKIIADYTLATPRDSFNHFLIMLKAVIDPLLESAHKNKLKIGGAGLGIAGIISASEGKILKSPNISFLNNKQIAKELEKIIALPVKIDNDANCFTRAEAKIGAGAKFTNVYALTIGTGIGGGWWVNNKIYTGAHGAANEPGHLLIDCQEFIDLEKAYHKLMQNNPAQMAEEAYRGDRLAERVYEEFGRLFGVSLVNIINILDPEIIIIGGSVAESSELFMNIVRKTVAEYSFSPVAKKIKIVNGKLGELAGAMGAAMLV